MYYLQSRYYDPVIGRFINADGVAYLGADGTLLAYNLFAYCGNNPVMGYDPTGNVNWSLIGKIALTTVVVAACLTGVGALAAAAATATAVSVSAAVTTAVVTAGISTVCAAVDGGICAVESGGDFADGFMAGAIGGSLGALVSNVTNPVPQTDGAYRMNLLGRAASSLTYDVTYDWFSGKLKAQNARECMQTYTLDIPLDVIGSIVYYDYTGLFNTGFAGSCIESAVNGIIDAIIDIVQVEVLFS